MGYTHFFRNKTGSKGYIKALSIVRKVLKKHKDIIQYEYNDTRAASCTKEMIRFNGIGDNGHETFWFENGQFDFEFCKTNRKEYDIVVCSVLLVLAHFMPDLVVSSDGFNGEITNGKIDISDIDGEWKNAIEAVKEYDITFKEVVDIS